MLLVLDTCGIGVGPEPTGGITLRIENIEGFAGNTLIIPLPKDSAVQILDEAAKIVGGPRIKPANLADLKRETRA